MGALINDFCPFQRKVPLTASPCFSLKEKKKLGWGEELRKKRREKHPYNPKFSKQHKGDFKDRHGRFFMCEAGSVILPSLCFHGQLGSIPKLKNKRPHCSEGS